jgi:RNA polymerase sigma-70 factor (ECF subfamily)
MNVKPDLVPLVLAAQQGDEDAYGRIVEDCWTDLVRFARSVVGEQDAEDVVQESLIAGWRDLPAVRHPARFRAWMFSVVFRKCLRWKRWRRVVLSLSQVRAPGTSGDPGAAVDVARLLSRLTSAQRAVLHLTVVEGLTDVEIAETLETAPSTVRAQRRRARERLAVLAGVRRHA